MKVFLNVIVFILLPCSILAQNGSLQIDTFPFIAKPDSIIKKTDEGFIYITTDTNAKIYDWIIPTPNNTYVNHIYFDYKKHIKNSYSIPIKNFNIKSFPRAWNSVYIYNKNYVLYAPSDWMSNSGFYITDSIIYITSSDPSDIYVMCAFTLMNNKTAECKIVNYAGENKTVSIEMHNNMYGIYTWTIFDNNNKIENKFLMQDSNLSKKLPMIVCDCGENKCIMEFEFEETDY